jgi:murein L,D-transpeptidase YcbB/YkuD
MARLMAVLLIWVFATGASFGQGSEVTGYYFPDFLDSLITYPHLPYINERVHSAQIIRSLYEKNGYRYFWSNRSLAVAAINELRKASTHGLLPDDYHINAIQSLRQSGGLTVRRRQMLTEVLITDGIILYYHHLQNGKIDPSRKPLALSTPNLDSIVVRIMEGRKVVNGRHILKKVKQATPDQFIYKSLYNARADLHQNVVNGGGRLFLDQIAILDVNLERLRWWPDAGKRLIFVNAADFRLYLLENNRKNWETRVVVGKLRTPTPWISSRIEYVVFNPSWTVPASIIEETLLPEIKKDGDYLSRHAYYIHDTLGALTDPESINWQSITIDSINFSIVQSPGSSNALGQVKFIFPNDHSIYMHDTPDKDLFDKNVRMFSHGCIRVEQPLVLARYLLDNNTNFRVKGINAIILSGVTQKISVVPPCPVILGYLTVSAEAGGKVKYLDDVYWLDQPIMQLLHQRIK